MTPLFSRFQSDFLAVLYHQSSLSDVHSSVTSRERKDTKGPQLCVKILTQAESVETEIKRGRAFLLLLLFPLEWEFSAGNRAVVAGGDKQGLVPAVFAVPFAKAKADPSGCDGGATEIWGEGGIS